MYSESSDEDSDFDTAIDDVIENKPRNESQQNKPPRYTRLIPPLTHLAERQLTLSHLEMHCNASAADNF